MFNGEKIYPVIMPQRFYQGFFLQANIFYIHFRKDLKNINLEIKNKPDTLFLIFTPEHGNLGDHAIAYSEIKRLNQLDIEFVEIPYFLLYRIADFKLLRIFNNKKGSYTWWRIFRHSLVPRGNNAP